MSGSRDTLLSVGLLVLRVGVGVMMMVHGIQKIQGFDAMAGGFPDPLGVGNKTSLILAIGAEFGCSILVIVGLATRLAALPLAFTMIIAVFVIHGADPWQKRELAALYLLIYSSLVFTGPGTLSLDHLWMSRRKQARGDAASISQ